MSAENKSPKPESIPRIGCELDDLELFKRFKAKLTMRGESIVAWANRMVALEVKGKLPLPK